MAFPFVFQLRLSKKFKKLPIPTSLIDDLIYILYKCRSDHSNIKVRYIHVQIYAARPHSKLFQILRDSENFSPFLQTDFNTFYKIICLLKPHYPISKITQLLKYNTICIT